MYESNISLYQTKTISIYQSSTIPGCGLVQRMYVTTNNKSK